MNKLIDKFIKSYFKEYDYYQEACKLCAQMCEVELEQNGIRSIITSRAKRPDRLGPKLEKRMIEKKYKNIEDIYKDIVDLSGVRIAIYFPGDREEVDKFIKNNFSVLNIKEFPQPKNSSYNKRFTGYGAVHYRVQLKEESLNGMQKRYSNAQIEIQVASVLMHAWAEVEHDLVYKPLNGELSNEEYAILDELNGLVLAGEIALERLQSAFKNRIKNDNKEFNSHYELSAFLFEQAKKESGKETFEPIMGRADILFNFLKLSNINDPDHLKNIVKDIDLNCNDSSIVDQIIDITISSNRDLYENYVKVQNEIGTFNPFSSKVEKVKSNSASLMGQFLESWHKLEKIVNTLVDKEDNKASNNFLVNIRYLTKIGVDNDLIFNIHRLRRIRNDVVHGLELPPIEFFPKYIERTNEVVMELEKLIGNDINQELEISVSVKAD